MVDPALPASTGPSCPEAPIVRAFDADAVAEAAALIRGGDIVAVPTETVYGLAADAGNADAVARIYAAKGRPSFNPLIVHVADLAAAEALAVIDTDARDLAERFWPGPLTLVLPLRPDAPIARLATAGLDTVAIRVPAHRAMQALLAAADRPLAAPSANRSNGISPTRAAHVVASLGSHVPFVIDDGACEAGLESTIVRGRQVLRPGPIATDALFPDGSATRAGGEATAQPVAPGQLATHYAPAKPLRLHAVTAADEECLIGFGAVAGDINLSPSGNVVEAAARLFDALHAADAGAKASIAVAPIPDSGIGEAINDRLARAATR
ncbi:translation factor SUA5 [Sphingomonas gellani]|uniref:Threonylcarbamoyl-AMP synthase n=1 Tax=Sphingomonas gellani TaxID=1166340 RepID=A0A1H8DLN2_9SPHN|nr:L-threonylcarbamoyladenylate synthase [Sphingomonas gellani]SEN07448.1 translation factor SUA5 [Sphingomonas gellani]